MEAKSARIVAGLLALLSLCGTMAPPVMALNLGYKYGRRMLCIGDSITWGTGQTNQWSYRQQLQADLGIGLFQFVGSHAAPPTDPNYYVFHEGIGGDCTADVLARIDAALDRYLPTPNLPVSAVLLHIGTNDVKSGTGCGVTEAQAVSNVADTGLTTASIVGKIHAHDPNLQVYVALIIPSTNVTSDANFTSYNTALNTRLTSLQSTKTNLFIVDMNSAFRNTANCASVAACVDDTVSHPNDAGYVVMGDTWYAALVSHQ